MVHIHVGGIFVWSVVGFVIATAATSAFALDLYLPSGLKEVGETVARFYFNVGDRLLRVFHTPQPASHTQAHPRRGHSRALQRHEHRRACETVNPSIGAGLQRLQRSRMLR